MLELTVIPRHSVYALSPEKPIGVLQTEKHIFKQEDSGFQAKMEKLYNSDAGFVQYTLCETSSNKTIPYVLRLKTESLTLIDTSKYVARMGYVLLDWDLPSKGILWTDPNKAEKKEDIKSFIEDHPILGLCAAYYFSKSGVRIVFALENPLDMKTDVDVEIWKSFYGSFVSELDVSTIGGEIENTGSRRSPFALSRVPRYKDVDGAVISGEIVFNPKAKYLRAVYPSAESVAKPHVSAKRKGFSSLPEDKVLLALWDEPFIKHCRENSTTLSYNDWRAVGINLYALLGDNAKPIFEEFSKWDTQNYNSTAVEKAWSSIAQSATKYGPTTWAQFNINLHNIYQYLNPRSSLAANIRRAVGNMISGTPNPLVDNTVQVCMGLEKSTKIVKGVAVSTITKTLTNLLKILNEDNTWKDMIKRNHLGAIDMIGDETLTDEHITEIRETVSRKYSLAYSKDEVWDVVKLIAQRNEFHPVADYLYPLKWDGVDRVQGLAAALGQTDAFANVLLKRFIISAVVRPIEWNNYSGSVNWKIDTVLVLKGGQGKRKSTFFKALCADEDWFSDNLPSIMTERKDASLHMLGKWLVEQAEFEGHIARSSVENMKAFITREREIFRKPYGRSEINMRRPAVLVGTTNSDSFLNDPTGDRRFWVLEIPKDHQINVNWIHQNRDQIWAQAVHLYQQGEQWWLRDDENDFNNVRNSNYRRPDPIMEAVDEYLTTNPTIWGLSSDDAQYENDMAFSLKQLVEVGLDKKLADIKPNVAQNIELHLMKLGWRKVRQRIMSRDVSGGVVYKRITCFRKLKGFVEEGGA